MSRYQTSYRPADYDDEEDDCDFDFVSSFEHSVEKTSKNLKITIVPDPAGIDDQPFDAQLEPELSDWFERFKKIFNVYKKSPNVANTIQSLLAYSENPYLDSLKLLANCLPSDYSKTGSIGYKLMEELAIFQQSNNNESFNRFVDDNLKMVAFNLVKKHGQQPIRMIVTAFKLKDSRHLFMDKIQEFLKYHQYKEACQIAYELEMFAEFSLYDFVFPLFLQDKYTTAEEYLEKAPHLQLPLIELLDSILDRSSSVSNNCGSYIAKYNYTEVKYSKLQAKPITKLITRLVKKFNISQNVTPNVNKMKNYGALQFLLHKKYVEKCLNKDSWEEMVTETVPATSSDLQLELVTGCSDNRDYEESWRWARHFKIEFAKLPGSLKQFIENQSNDKNEDNVDEDWDDIPIKGKPANLEPIHTFPLSDTHLILVDCKEQFSRMINDLKYQTLVALDAEWKPTFGANTEVALIQLATRNDVYLIDNVILDLEAADWGQLGKHVFNNDEILKLGFAPTSDLSMLQKSLPTLNLLSHSWSLSSYLDLQELWRKLNTIQNFKFPYPGDINENLSNLVRKCLGKKLDKSNQFSNWEQRPLRYDQIRYAALDAFCLIEIYDIIERELAKIGINYEEFLYNFLTENKTRMQMRKKDKTTEKTPREHQEKYKRGRQNESSRTSHGRDAPQTPQPLTSHPSVKVHEIQFVVDSMLGGLGKTLRKCGIDCHILSSRDHHDVCIRVAVDEIRCVLTRGSLYNKYVQYISPIHCLRLQSDDVDEQLLEVIKFFNIRVDEANIFSRCQVCNVNEFILISQQDLMSLNRYFQRDSRGSSSPSSSSSRGSSPPINRSWIIQNLSAENRLTGKTSRGAVMQIFGLPEHLVRDNDYFYVCDGCGKCYWDGSHYQNAISGNIRAVLNMNRY